MLYNHRYDLINKTLLDAADILEREGWCQFIQQNRQGQRCLTEAIMATSLPIRFRHAAIQRLQDYLNEYVMEWNDYRCRTKQQAIAALKSAASTEI